MVWRTASRGHNKSYVGTQLQYTVYAHTLSRYLSVSVSERRERGRERWRVNCRSLQVGSSPLPPCPAAALVAASGSLSLTRIYKLAGPKYAAGPCAGCTMCLHNTHICTHFTPHHHKVGWSRHVRSEPWMPLHVLCVHLCEEGPMLLQPERQSLLGPCAPPARSALSAMVKRPCGVICKSCTSTQVVSKSSAPWSINTGAFKETRRALLCQQAQGYACNDT